MRKEKVIIIKLVGGLGNQMFQWAVANILAKKTRSYILIDNQFFFDSKKRPGHTPRNFELDIFVSEPNIASDKILKDFTKLSLKNKLYKKLGFNFPKIYNEKEFSNDANLFAFPSPIYLKGFFQSYKYFEGWEEFVHQLFPFSVHDLGKENLRILQIIKTTKSISIHLRRGDYIKDPIINNFHGTCSIDYYLKAINILTNGDPNYHLFFFSDEINWAQENFQNLPYSTYFIDHNTGKNSWKDMMLMSSCEFNIIANSSFSWWAAWLNKNPEKIIIAPNQWFLNNHKKMQMDDLIPPQWTRI